MNKKKKIVIASCATVLLSFSFGRSMGAPAEASATRPTAPVTVTSTVAPAPVTVTSTATSTVTKTVPVKVRTCDTGAAWKAYSVKITEAGAPHNKAFQDYLAEKYSVALEEVAHAKVLTDDAEPLLLAAFAADKKCGR